MRYRVAMLFHRAASAAGRSTDRPRHARWSGLLPWPALVPALAWLVHSLPALPPALPLVWSSIAAASCAGLAWSRGLSRMAHAGLLIAVSFALAALFIALADRALEARLPRSLEGVDLVAVGYPVGLIRASPHGRSFDFVIESCRYPSPRRQRVDWCDATRTVRLSEPDRKNERIEDRAARNGDDDHTERLTAFVPGERRSLVLRLRRIHGVVNPGGFDSELRALEEGISARGQVRAVRALPGSTERNANGARAEAFAPEAFAPMTRVDRARMAVIESMSVALSDWPQATRGTLIALVTGDQTAIPSGAWQIFNRTAVAHLMSISGVHVTFFATLTMLIVRWLLRVPGLVPASWLLRVPATVIVLMLGTASALAYSLFAGWGIPAQRTSIMLGVVALALHSGRATSMTRVLSVAAAVVTLLDPWAPLAAGFWLSFVAVAAIVGFGGGIRMVRERWWLSALRTQWAATLALLPMGAVWFGSVSMVGPLANAIAIPLVSSVVTPLALLGAFVQQLAPVPGAWILDLAAAMTDALLAGLTWLSSWSGAVLVTGQPPLSSLLPAALACVLLLTPWRPVKRRLAALLLGPILLLPVDPLAPGRWRLIAIDVGQGTSVLVQTSSHAVLFDTGPTHDTDTGAGDRIVAPMLQGLGIGRLDLLVLSHADADHTGGAASVIRTFDVARLATSIDRLHPIVAASRESVRCSRGMRWQWDDVDFEFLHPDAGTDPDRPPRSHSNASSCVLRVSGPGGSALLTGDIGKKQENDLLRMHGAATLRADVLVAPHHGSATSSTGRFLDAVAPRWSVFQMGYRNRFGHPARSVQGRYESRGARMLLSDREGAVEFRFATGHEPELISHRRIRPRYWRTAVP